MWTFILLFQMGKYHTKRIINVYDLYACRLRSVTGKCTQICLTLQLILFVYMYNHTNYWFYQSLKQLKLLKHCEFFLSFYTFYHFPCSDLQFKQTNPKQYSAKCIYNNYFTWMPMDYCVQHKFLEICKHW